MCAVLLSLLLLLFLMFLFLLLLVFLLFWWFGLAAKQVDKLCKCLAQNFSVMRLNLVFLDLGLIDIS